MEKTFGKDNILNQNSQKQRIASLDVLRTIAILCVLITHASDSSYSFVNLDVLPDISLAQRLFALTLHIVGRCGVPIFFFLTGYLTLSKTFQNSSDILSFWKKHLIPLYVTSTIWGVIYFAYAIVVEHQSLDFMDFIMEVLLFKQYEGTQFWYLPVILGIYLFLPFVSIILEKVDQKIILCVCVFSLLFLTFTATINPILSVKDPTDQFAPLLDLSWSGGRYGLLVLLGYWIKTMPRKINRRAWLPIGLACYLFLLIEENYCFTHGYAYDLWYDNIFLVILCVAIFEFVLPMHKIILNSLFTWISKNAFGIFLIHEIFIKTLLIYFPKVVYWRKFLLLFILTTGLSMSAVFLLGLNKKIGWVLLYKKS